MATRKDNATIIAALLALAALVCLGIGLRLMAASGQPLPPAGLQSPYQFVATLAIIGGLVIFLLGAIALLAARRYALGNKPLPDTPPLDLDVTEIQDWGRELADVRDILRTTIGPDDSPAAITLQTVEIPTSWRPAENYLLQPNGRPSDSLADHKQTRERLREASERVNVIVQAIQAANVTDCHSARSKNHPPMRRFWHFLRRRP